jgi:hypothetical protein
MNWIQQVVLMFICFHIRDTEASVFRFQLWEIELLHLPKYSLHLFSKTALKARCMSYLRISVWLTEGAAYGKI